MKIAVEKVERDERGRCVACGNKISKKATMHYCRAQRRPRPPKRAKGTDAKRGDTAKAKAATAPTPAVEPAGAPPEPPTEEITEGFSLADVWGAEDEPENGPEDVEGAETPEGDGEKVDAEERSKVRAILSEGGATIYKYWHRALQGAINWGAGTAHTPEALALNEKEEKELAELGNLAYPLDVSAKAAYVAALFTIFGGHLLMHLDKIAARLGDWGKKRKEKSSAKKKLDAAKKKIADKAGGEPDGEDKE